MHPPLVFLLGDKLLFPEAAPDLHLVAAMGSRALSGLGQRPCEGGWMSEVSPG